jgi:hypothetical protein
MQIYTSYLSRSLTFDHQPFSSTSRLLQLASVSAKPKVILSSGSRVVEGGEGGDAGIMAFRTHADLINVMEVVMKFDRNTAFEALHTAGAFALQQAHVRRFEKQSITVTGVAVRTESDLEADEATARSNSTQAPGKEGDTVTKKQATKDVAKSKDEDDEDYPSHNEDEDGDGFVAF